MITLDKIVEETSKEKKFITEEMNENDYKKESDTLTKSYGVNSRISTTKRNILNTIKTGIQNLQSTINLDKYVSYISTSKVGMNYYFDTLYEYPELFYPDLTVSCAYYKNSNGGITKFSLKVSYLYNAATIKILKSNLTAKVNEIKNNYLYNASGNIEKEYIIHDYLLENCTYDTSSNVPTASHTAYAALLTGKAVCEGYAKAAKLLFNECNIDSGIVTSDSMNHAWNYIKLNGYYYFLDITWDDPVPETFISSYSYFNRNTTEMIKGNHNWVTGNFPSSTSTLFSFLRSYNKLTRSNNYLYYYDVNSKILYRMTLDGKSKTVVRSGFYFNNSIDIIGYSNNLYYVKSVYYSSDKKTYNTITKYNLSTQKETVMFRTLGNIKKIYKKNLSLYIQYTASQNSSTIYNTSISIKVEGDTNRDGIVNMADVSNVASKFNKKAGQSGYLAAWDFNGDGIIDIYDIAKVVSKL